MSNNDEVKDGRGVSCSFCGKPQSEARRLIAGPGVYICDECIELCMSILEDEKTWQTAEPPYEETSMPFCLSRRRLKHSWTSM